MQKKIKSLAKKIMGINTNITKSSFKEENFCKSLKCLVSANPELLSNNSHVGKRKDGKNFYTLREKALHKKAGAKPP